MSDPRRAITVLTTASLMSSEPGPFTPRYYFALDTEQFYRFAPGSTATADDYEVFEPSGGTAGRFLRLAGVGGTMTVATLADLPDAQSGLAWVTSRGALYVCEAGTWRRLRVSSPRYAAAANLYISNAGSDDNTGLTSDSPLLTVAEVMARLADNPVATPVLHVLDSLNEDECFLNFAANKDGLHSLTIEGTPTVDLTTTIAAATAWNASGGTVGTIRGTASLASHVGKVFRISGGARDGAIGTLIRVESGTDILISPMRSALFYTDAVTPQVGDTIEVLSLPTFADNVTVSGGAVVYFSYLTLADGQHAFTADAGSQVYLSGCKVTSDIDAGYGSLLSLAGCYVTGSYRGQGASYADAYGCYLYQVTGRTNCDMRFGDVVIDNYATFDTYASAQIDADTFLWIDNPPSGAYAVSLDVGASLRASGTLAGRGLSSPNPAMVTLWSGARLFYTAAPSFTGTGTQMRIGGTTKNFTDLPFMNTTNGAVCAPIA